MGGLPLTYNPRQCRWTDGRPFDHGDVRSCFFGSGDRWAWRVPEESVPDMGCLDWTVEVCVPFWLATPYSRNRLVPTNTRQADMVGESKSQVDQPVDIVQNGTCGY